LFTFIHSQKKASPQNFQRMKKPVLTHVGSVLLVVGLICIFQKQFMLAGILLGLSYFSIFLDYYRFTKSYQLLAGLVCTADLGLYFYFLTPGSPWLWMMMLCLAPVGLLRSLLLDRLTHVKYLWFEPLCIASGLTCYFVGNLSASGGWIGWVLPVIPILCMVFQTVGYVFDGIRLKKEAVREEQAQSGVAAPLFSLSDSEGRKVSLANFKGTPVLLVFVRGDWCPFCHMMLRSYQQRHELFKEKGIHLLIIGPDPIGVNKEMAEKFGLTYQLLSDEHLEATRLYGLRVTQYFAPAGVTYDEDKSVPLPASFLIDKTGIIRYVSRPDQIGRTVSFEEIFPVLKNIQ
jgi:peroxiredoxin